VRKGGSHRRASRDPPSAEACDAPVRWSCRAGVCHSCESGLVSGTVTYRPEPLDGPADGNLLLCCAQPAGDVALDL